MVNLPHEAHHRAFQELPELFTSAFQLLGLPDPGHTTTDVLNCDLTDIKPLERRADTVVRLETAERTYLLIVEAQSRDDSEKARSWGYYLGFLANKYPDDCPLLLVLCRDRKTARWAAGPFRIGHEDQPNLHVTPFVLGPDNVPVVADVEVAAADLPLAVFSTMTHCGDPGIGDILEVLTTALSKSEDPRVVLYSDLVAGALAGSPAAETWRKLVDQKITFRGPVSEALEAKGEARGEARGEAKGEAASLLKLLELRGLPLGQDEHDRIIACRDHDILTRWFERAFSAATTAQVFADDDAEQQSPEADH